MSKDTKTTLLVMRKPGKEDFKRCFKLGFDTSLSSVPPIFRLVYVSHLIYFFFSLLLLMTSTGA